MKKGLLGPDPGHYYYKLFFRRLPPPGQSGQPERRGERSLPHRPAIKGRRPTETSEARFRAHRKCTYHLGFSLGELRGLEAKFRTALADETAQIDQDFTGHENGESSELRALINRASRGAEFGPAFAALAAGRNMPDGAMSELQVHRGLPGYLLPLDVVMPTLCSKGASWQNSRLGSFCSANVTCVAKIWSSSLTTVQPMSTGTVLPSASRDRAEPLTGALSLCSSALGTAMKVDPVSTVSDTYGYNQFFHCGFSLKLSRVPPWVIAVFCSLLILPVHRSLTLS